MKISKTTLSKDNRINILILLVIVLLLKDTLSLIPLAYANNGNNAVLTVEKLVIVDREGNKRMELGVGKYLKDQDTVEQIFYDKDEIPHIVTSVIDNGDGGYSSMDIGYLSGIAMNAKWKNENLEARHKKIVYDTYINIADHDNRRKGHSITSSSGTGIFHAIGDIEKEESIQLGLTYAPGRDEINKAILQLGQYGQSGIILEHKPKESTVIGVIGNNQEVTFMSGVDRKTNQPKHYLKGDRDGKYWNAISDLMTAKSILDLLRK